MERSPRRLPAVKGRRFPRLADAYFGNTIAFRHGVDIPLDLAACRRLQEACLVLPDSPKASVALSRRCLQHILREAAKVKHGDLYAGDSGAFRRGQASDLYR